MKYLSSQKKEKQFRYLKGLKILFSAEDFWPRLGGGEAFIDEFLTELAKNNEVHCIYVGDMKQNSKLTLHPIKKSYAYKNMPLFNRTLIRQYYANKRWKKVLRKKIKEINPDLIITQLIYTPATADVAKEFNLPLVLFIHNYEHFSPTLFKDVDALKIMPGEFSYLPLSYKLQWPFYKWLIKWHESALKKADLILPDSHYVAYVAKKFCGVESYPYFPVVDLKKYLIPKEMQKKNKREFITLINPIKYRGIDVLINIAEKMPDRKFLVVCGAMSSRVDSAEKINLLKNVEFMRECPDIKVAYSKTRVLLVPSIWPDPFGRVIMEAGINGIPSIITPLGAAKEAAGKGGLVVNNLYDYNEWAEKIKNLDNNAEYKKLSRNAKKHTNSYSLKKQIARFRKLLNQSV